MPEEPHQMTIIQMRQMVKSGENPVKISIEKYRMLKAWVQHRIDTRKIGDLWDRSNLGMGHCALCYLYFDDDKDSCEACPLFQAGHGCNESLNSLWHNISDKLPEMDSLHWMESSDSEFIDVRHDLLVAIDNMIAALNEILNDPNYKYEYKGE